jgi:uncharacterized protein (TIGR03663 family)
MKPSRLSVLGLTGCTALGLLLRLPGLDLRPMHTDEAVHAVKFAALWQDGRYIYDPGEYHGPLLYYATLPAVALSGARAFEDTTETAYRIVPALFGAGLVVLVVLLADGLGWSAAFWAAAMLAVSPALTFYSRYYIQETLLAFFSLLVIAAAWRYVCRPGLVWALVCGGAAGAMHATKETCIISFGCLAAGAFVARGWRRGHGPHRRSDPRKAALHAAAAVAVGLALSVTLYSSCLCNWAGVAGSFRAYATYFERAAAGVHIYPWYYYLRILAYSHLARGPRWSEATILILAAAGAFLVLRPAGDRTPSSGSKVGGAAEAHSFLRFLAAYAVLMVVVYSAIPYKTPWCLIQFLVPLCLLAGYAAGGLIRSFRARVWQVVMVTVLLGAVAHLCWQSWRASFRFYSDYRNPYVYAQPLRDVTNLAGYIEKLAAAYPAGRQIVIGVIAYDPWPLPWYLRRFRYVGYFETLPAEIPAAIWIVAAQRLEELPPQLLQNYHMSVYGLRPDMKLFVFVAPQLREAFERQTGGGGG